jgi:hypothetical protein
MTLSKALQRTVVATAAAAVLVMPFVAASEANAGRKWGADPTRILGKA